MRRRSGGSSWSTALAAVAVSRLLWLGIFAVVVAVNFPGTPLLTGIRDHLVSWDAVSYMTIAAHGYPGQLSYLDAFLPGFPLVVHVVAVVTRDNVTAAWVVNAIAETVGLWYLGRTRPRRTRPGLRNLLDVVARARADSPLPHRAVQ